MSLIAYGAGVLTGWLMFKRPELVTRFFNWAKTKLGVGTAA